MMVFHFIFIPVRYIIICHLSQSVTQLLVLSLLSFNKLQRRREIRLDNVHGLPSDRSDQYRAFKTAIASQFSIIWLYMFQPALNALTE